MIVPVILAGGSGSRLWPLSRGQYPKQFIAFDDQGSLLQQTLKRCQKNEIYSDPVVVTNEDYRFLVAQQAHEIDVPLNAILLEPSARNTAPALCAVAWFCLQKFGDDTILHIMPSDHLLDFDETMGNALNIAKTSASEGALVTFGIKPTVPATGYGYIEAGEMTATGACSVARFTEKPDQQTAQSFIDKGGYYWNSGMFVFAAQTFLNEIEQYEPAMLDLSRRSVEQAETDLDFTRLDKSSFEEMKSISVDYAVFERTDRCVVVPTDINWSDLGTFDAIKDQLPKDQDGNALSGDHLMIEARNNLVISDDTFVAVTGVENLAVVVTDDAVLVSPLDQSEQIKSLVETIKSAPDKKHLSEEHTLTYRPWGGYASILKGERFQIKRLFVKPGAKLSLQKHHHRSEHWVVVTGTAEVTIDDDVQMLGENQSTYIPLGAVHRLANPGKILLEVIEVQIGPYLGEDDIIRIEDEFGRQ